ncbi:MAG: PHP domain-containing protein [Calditrichaeota bacterium]|nr:MAG: PHP domain-containing protein [Calditrichota bacterium]
MAVDLHCHTTASDGTLTPSELIAEAQRVKLTALALTDHDTVAGLAEARNAARDSGLTLVPGVELSIDFPLPGKAHLHLLGLFIDPENEILIRTLNELAGDRERRAEKIIEQLNAHGMDLSIDELRESAAGSIGRPHVASLMARKGYVNSVWEAFDKYLAKGKPGYVGKRKLTLPQAVELVHQAGGLALVAHPVSLNQPTYAAYTRLFREFKKQGVDGVEVYYSSHTWHFVKYLLQIADRLGWCISGGSDFHGTVKPDIHLGKGRGNLYVPDALVEQLLTFRLNKYGEKGS